MVSSVYAFRDIKTTFMSPFVDLNDDSAKRGFTYAVHNTGSIMNYAPSDFELYRIGSYDSVSGAITPCLPEFICSGLDVYGKEVSPDASA